MRRLWLRGLVGILATAGAWGCGEATSNPPASGGAGAGGSNAGRGNAGGGASAGASAGTAGSGNSNPVLCGGGYRNECASGKLCMFDTGCGTVGSCVLKPSRCDNVGQPTCGCDGKTYGNPCEARSAGVALQHDGACDEPAQFTCGPYACAKGNYCIDKGADRDAVWRYACLTLPAACAGEPGCDCLGEVKGCFVGHDCAVTGAGVTATCQ